MSSQILPSSIDSTYPVPGVNNSSQGFRNNFAAIKSNFTAAQSEINDLLDKVVVKSPLTYGANSEVTNNDLAGNQISNAVFRNCGQATVDLGNTINSVEIDLTAGNKQMIVANSASSITALSFAGFADTTYSEVDLTVTVDDISNQVSLPTTNTNGDITWVLANHISGYDPATHTITYLSNGIYAYRFSSVDGGNTITMSQTVGPVENFDVVSSPVGITSGTLTSTGLTVNTIAGTRYSISGDIWFHHSSASTNTYVFSLQYGTTGAGTGIFTVEQQAGNASAYNVHTITTSNSTVSSSTTTDTNTRHARITGTFTHTENTSLTVTASTNGGTLTISPGSMLKITPLF